MPTTTFTVAVNDDDGRVEGNGATYPPSFTFADATAPSSAARGWTGVEYVLYNGLVRWSTSALASAPRMIAARFRFYVFSVNNADARNLVGEWYPGSNWPIDSGDYTTTPPAGGAATFAFSVALSSLTAAAWNEVTLSNLSESNISLSGYTGLRLHVDGGTPTGNNTVAIYTRDNGFASQLIIDHDVYRPLMVI